MQATATAGAGAQWSFEAAGDGQFKLDGIFGFTTCMPILERSRALLADCPAITIDLAGVTHADSAGLAVLLEWVSWAKQGKRALRYLHMPQQLRAIARISETDELLQAG